MVLLVHIKKNITPILAQLFKLLDVLLYTCRSLQYFPFKFFADSKKLFFGGRLLNRRCIRAWGHHEIRSGGRPGGGRQARGRRGEGEGKRKIRLPAVIVLRSWANGVSDWCSLARPHVNEDYI